MKKIVQRIFIGWKRLVAKRERATVKSLRYSFRYKSENKQLRRELALLEQSLAGLEQAVVSGHGILLQTEQEFADEVAVNLRLKSAMRQIANEAERFGRVDAGAVKVAMELACDPEYTGLRFLFPLGEHPPLAQFRFLGSAFRGRAGAAS